MVRSRRLVLVVTAALTAATLGSVATADGRTSPSLRFFTGGAGAHTDWLATADQPVGDTDPQALRLVTTTDPYGYTGVLVQHVEGRPTATFPDSSFDVKAVNYTGSSQGSPRLVVQFSDGGNAALRPLTLTEAYQPVTSPNWDNNSGGCGYLYERNWSEIQDCHAGTTITAVYLVADPLGIEYRVDNLTVDGVRFTSAKQNGAAG